MTALALYSTWLAGIPWKKVGGWLSKASLWLVAVLKPFGVWGVFGLSIVDSAAIPMLFLDPLIVSDSVAAPSRAFFFCLAGAVGSAIGSMLPYSLGRAGGELFLLKRINRERYEKLRDRFEKQEFLAIMLPAMCPPPMPVKIVELAAGVLEMRPSSYFLAVTTGKFFRFLIEFLLVLIFGPAILSSFLSVMHRHFGLVMGALGLLLLFLLVQILRRVFNKRRGTPLPLEEQMAATDPVVDDIASPS
jgi:membrane protein YqaA with SNARE-associated domain